MTSVRIHAALLAITSVLALATWLGDTGPAGASSHPPLWSVDTLGVSISYESGPRRLDIGWRTDEGGPFAWAVEVGPRPGTDAVDTLAYPLGVVGMQVVRALAELRPLRDLGPVAAERLAEFGLGDPHAVVRVEGAGGMQTLQVGDSVFRSSDRYAVHASTGRVYVVPSEAIEPLRVGSGAIRERALHAFLDRDVARVIVRSEGRERVMDRTDGGNGGAVGWTPVDSPTRPDPTFASFMERVGQLAIADFERVDGDRLDTVLRVEYIDEDGGLLGFAELARGPGADAWYITSERTHAPARAINILAARVAQDATEIF